MDELSGGTALYKILIRLGIHWTSWQRWLKDQPELVEEYQEAKTFCADRIFDQILEIADTELPDDDFCKVDSAKVQQLRVRIDARKLMAGQLAPKKYQQKPSLESFVVPPSSAQSVVILPTNNRD